jgi:hypothetical protein
MGLGINRIALNRSYLIGEIRSEQLQLHLFFDVSVIPLHLSILRDSNGLPAANYTAIFFVSFEVFVVKNSLRILVSRAAEIETDDSSDDEC